MADDASRVARRVVVAGLVQGVFFRQAAVDRAGRLGLAGWVRNLPDGRVEVLVEGPPSAVEAMIAWAQDGPPRADVTSLEVDDEPVTGLTDFHVRY